MAVFALVCAVRARAGSLRAAALRVRATARSEKETAAHRERRTLSLPLHLGTEELNTLLNQLLSNDEETPYAFFVKEGEDAETAQEEDRAGESAPIDVGDAQVVEDLANTIEKHSISTEKTLRIVYQPQALFRVRPITRCTGSLQGHADAVLHVHFSPDGQSLASGSGDTTVRLWDIHTQTPITVLKGHRNWILRVAFSPDGKTIISGSMDNSIRAWDASTGKPIGKPMTLHTKWITDLEWEPMHRNPECSIFASASKDATIRIWNVKTQRVMQSLSGHTAAVTALRWGGEGLLYSASQDRTIRVWSPHERKLVRILERPGHAHWVNSLSLNNEFILRSGPYDHKTTSFATRDEMVEAAKSRYAKYMEGKKELLVSGSDDHTLYLWSPTTGKQPIKRLTGHQQPVIQVVFSPDGRWIASASFDGSVRIWNGASGSFVATFRGHVGAVYKVAWSADSRMLISASKDSTVKLWDIARKKLREDLPGHADEVYAVDWSPDGVTVATGSKDKLLKVWRH